MNGDYLLVKVAVSRDQAECTETVMLDCGALSCTYQDATDTPIHEPAPGTAPLWPDVVVTGIFAQGSDSDIVTHLVRNAIDALVKNKPVHAPLANAQISVESLPDTDWERAWMDDFKPLQIDSNLWVVPSHYEAVDDAAVNISIDPGLAFGSGTHPTTHLCLQWLSKLDLKDKVVVDYGCGSGILAVAAARLGAARVYGFDIDPQALQATLANASNNQVADKITICTSDKNIPAGVDIVVANILLAPLLELRTRFCELLKEDGQLGVSGVLSEQLPVLAGAYSIQLRHSESEIREQWAMYTAVKQGEIST